MRNPFRITTLNYGRQPGDLKVRIRFETIGMWMPEIVTVGSIVVLALCVLVSVSGCVGPQAPRAVCPVIVPYSLADDRALEAALQAHPSPVVSRYLRDYAGLRDQARACARP